MRKSSSIFQVIIILSAFISLTSAASAALFCKCMCRTNNTIVPLNGDWTCNDCNKQFCIDNNLPGCREVELEDITTACFQRDSTKDQLVVYTFILVTVGLLAYAVLQPWIEKWSGLIGERADLRSVNR